EREPDRVPERREDERGVDQKRRQQVEVADPARRARRLDATAVTPPKPCRPPQRECCGGRLGVLLGEAQLLWNFE
ncbi:MAG: hypothetical protein ACJ74P_11580, partial [Gaiellaceae bacterium]